MDWTIGETAEVAPLVPLLAQMHAIHVAARPDLFRLPPDHSAYAAELEGMLGDGMTAVVAEGPGAAALGYAVLAIEERAASALCLPRRWGVLHHVAVDAAWRGRGIGAALLAEAVERARAAGASHVSGSHWAFNDASAALMRRAGLSPYLVPVGAPLSP